MGVKTYRKKPVGIEAIQFSRKNYGEVREFTNNTAKNLIVSQTPGSKYTCIIPTLEGNMVAQEGDYIIKGVQGEFYPCKPEIFEATYEEM